MPDITGDVERAVAEMFDMNKRAAKSEVPSGKPCPPKNRTAQSVTKGINISSDTLLVLGVLLILLDECDDKLLLFALIYLLL